jgi:hypothetical protein
MLQPREAGGVDGEARHRIQSIPRLLAIPDYPNVHNDCLEMHSLTTYRNSQNNTKKLN